ncbi:DUF2460 domain-containing protein [Methylobacterium brachiatum]|uniref:DUF2460 domain-containing protein n=1 Tax=Methylobacterium brachiatum TaxID=269660 RepID=UPI000EFB5905|nr:DUF2460 domain-containing protein [Methylobacterium brachiatum]AYO84032.1 TIGR02217 family protein [Methylobacterium brachiatum]
MADAFHEVLFPLDVSLRGSGGPQRLTEIVTLASGREHRNGRWADSRRRYDAGFGLRGLESLHAVLAFFEERRGRLYGFRYRDRVDFRSGPPGRAIGPLDQALGTGDGATASFPLIKTYGSGFAPYRRHIAKPVAGSVRVAVAGREVGADAFACDPATGLVTFAAGHVPPQGAAVTAGFAFDVPVRFDTDDLTIDLAAFAAGEIPKVPLVEIVP